MSHEFRFHEDMARKSREQLETDLREAEKDRDEYKRRWKASEQIRAQDSRPVCRGEACPNLGDSDYPPCATCPRRAQ